MTLVAPPSSRSRQRSKDAKSQAPLAFAIAPPTGQTAFPDHPVGLGGTARLGAGLLLLLALVLQSTVLQLLPWGPADLITVMVASIAILAGPAAGCVSGFAIGLVADVLSDHALGRLAAVLCVVGYLCGLVPTGSERRIRVVWLTIGVAAVLTPLGFALTGAFAGDTRAAGSLLLTRCLAGLAYGLVLAPFVYPLTRRLLSPRTVRRRRRMPQ